MINSAYISQIVEDYLSGSDLFITDIIIKSGNKIGVYVDSDKGITINQCVEISRHIYSVAQEALEEYEVQVSSPGINASLKIPRQYQKNIGRKVEVTYPDGEKIAGILRSVSENSFEIEIREKVKIEGKKKMQLVTQNQIIDYKEIKSTKVVPEFTKAKQ